MMTRPKVAFFDFACCEGCQLQATNLGEELLEVLQRVDVVEWREAMTETWEGRFDIAIVEGSITNEEAVEKIRTVRQRSDVVIAYGSCATIGGVNGMINRMPLPQVRAAVYGTKGDWFSASEVRAVHQVVNVDYFVHGCPIYLPEFVEVLKSALAGLSYHVPDYAVCVECKLNENVCMYDKGVTCLGPVTRAGCNSWCVNNGNICYGCRGMVSNPNRSGAEDVLRRYDLKADLIANKMTMYFAAMEGEDD